LQSIPPLRVDSSPPTNRFLVRLPSMLLGSDDEAEDEEAGNAAQQHTQAAAFVTPQKRSQSTGASQTDDYSSPYDHGTPQNQRRQRQTHCGCQSVHQSVDRHWSHSQ
jgi:hypothetical protein